MDGFTVKLKKNRMVDFKNTCDKFYNEVLPIKQEFDRYQECWIESVNSYHITKVGGKVKRKGSFLLPSEQDPHKNNSAAIIPIAIHRYITKGIPLMNTIKNHITIKNDYDEYEENGKKKHEIRAMGVFDYCIGVKAQKSPERGKSHFVLTSIKNKKIHEQKLQKTNRFFVSKSGGKMIKKYEDGSQAFVVAKPYYNTVVNQINDPFDQKYQKNIQYRYYYNEAHKLLKKIKKDYDQKNNTISLF